MYFALNAGKTSLLKVPQWLQVREAYSTIFTLAFGSPRVMSAVSAVPAPFEQPARASAPKAAATRRRRLKFGICDLCGIPNGRLKRDSRRQERAVTSKVNRR